MNLEPIASSLRGAIKGRAELDWPTKSLTTYRLGGPAALYFEPADSSDLERLAAALREHQTVPFLVLGRGSNLVISDAGWEGIVLRMGDAWSWIEPSGETGMVAGGSTPLPLLANWSARRGLSGVEFAVAIPGSVGGAVRMNAGAHESEIAGCLREVELFDLDSLQLRKVAAEDLDLSYRHSNLTDRQVVTEARFELVPEDPAAIKQRIAEYRRHRAETQPGALQNAGSVFKNPPGDKAGRLIEAAGLKGFRVGGASVSELHANFFMSSDDATAQDVYDLVRAVRNRVKETFGVDLEPEIRFAGRFEERVVNGIGGLP